MLSSSTSKKMIISGVIGNALEIYDYMIWGLFSVFLSREFLPPQSKLSDIFFLFLLSYFFRPLSGLIGGMLSDQIGRKKILILSLVLMGIGTGFVSILPSYERIGGIALFLLLVIRLIQTLAVSSEYINSISLLIESCDKKNRGYFGSWTAFGLNLGMLIASLVGGLILHLVESNTLPSWGWRLAFLLSFATTAFGLWIRTSIPESYEFITYNTRHEKRHFPQMISELIDVIKSQLFQSVLIFFLVLLGVSTTVLIFVLAPMHMSQISLSQSFIMNSASLTLLIALIPIFGWLSDRYGRAKTLGFGIIALLALAYPYFQILSLGNIHQIFILHVLIAIPSACIFAVTPVFITEIFPLPIRCSITNLIYSLAACFGGGLTPLIALKISDYTDSNRFSGIILIVFGSIDLLLLGVFIRRKKQNHTHLVLVK
jgi:MHS family proline/betaine transporter-like MFS transporter